MKYAVISTDDHAWEKPDSWTSRVLFGSDFPHAEGMAEPVDFVDAITSLPHAQVRMIMRENAKELVAGIA